MGRAWEKKPKNLLRTFGKSFSKIAGFEIKRKSSNRAEKKKKKRKAELPPSHKWVQKSQSECEKLTKKSPKLAVVELVAQTRVIILWSRREHGPRGKAGIW